MVPSITFQQLRNVTFPVYPISDDNLYFRDGLLTDGGLIIDDKNMPGATLGIRRLQTTHKLKRLTKSIPDITNILKSNKLVFIDSSGAIFRYNKTRFVPVHYRKIKRVDLHDTHSTMWLVGVNTPFTLKRPPQEGEEWAGVIYLNGFPWEIYELCRTHQPPTKKKI